MYETLPVTVKVKLICTNEKIQEWCQSLVYFSTCVVKKSFDDSTHDYPGVIHEREAILVIHSKVSWIY